MNIRKFSLVCLFVSAVLVFLPATAAAKDEWLQVRSKNFFLIGNASERDIRKAATKLEQFRETFRLLFAGTKLNASIPTNVIVFKNDSAYKPFKPKRADGKIDNFVAGYFQSGQDVNYITLTAGGTDADTYGTIFHEYVHFIINTNFGKSDIPPWFNEGLAEYYQTFEIEEDQKVKLGLPQGGHLRLLQENKLVPLETFFGISNYALHQNANHSRSIFYAQAWALIHYLVQSGKTDGLNKFLTLSLSNTPPEKAFHDAFQIDYAQMEKDLRKYVGRNTYQYHSISFKNKLVFDNEMQVSPLPEAESNAFLGDLLYRINRGDDAVPFLENALRLDPKLGMASTSLGMVKLDQRKFDEAKVLLEKAISLDQTNHLALYRYAYLLSREGRDEFGYVRSFPADTAAKMRGTLKKAIAVNPAFAASYDLLAFVNLVNNEDLEESVAYMQKALEYQPGNQQHALRLAEIYSRQQKYSDAAAIAEKIAKTTDDAEVKSRAEGVLTSVRQIQEMTARNEEARKNFERTMKGSGPPVLIRRTGDKPPTPEELAKARAEADLRAINGSMRTPLEGETRVIGNIQKVECKGRTITYLIKTDSEAFTLSSKDFQGLTLTAYIENPGVEIGCGAQILAVKTVLTFKPIKTGPHRGELIAVDFVPDNFRLIDVGEAAPTLYVAEETAPMPTGEEFEKQRRAAMLKALKDALRKPGAGEQQALGYLEKTECDKRGIYFVIRTGEQLLKLSNSSPQSVPIRVFTPDLEGLRFGCGMKPIEIPVVFTYKTGIDLFSNAAGELVSLEFVPKGFSLE